jgi:hypothetical protein
MKPLEIWPTFAAILLSATLFAGTTPLAAQPPDEVPETKLVQINLLAASKAGANELSDLPANTRKAIEDIRDFLPFKSYRLLDTSLVRVLVPSHRGAPGRGPSKTFMRGPDNTKLEIMMSMTTGETESEVFVGRFEVSPSVMDRLRAVTLTPEQQNQADTGAPVVAPRADLIDSGSLISTSFTAEVGQTVVVGSSRLNGGDDALIVLFTALP